ncbi:hypothetical protein FHS82_001029 [Pseudochelatococcus lubricantis]|uniref:Toprim domain-containing protein n=1 Tax=Pseudochelatococcus lubricantis TaxID=1538102 RepID=A0ABX0UW80_9HYPH|nr:hypothetical protein [Pseudochelatococcus lubricantis]NIJ57203.1 hypothetical protein [Pseudochelatococcus lubricantis]
MRAQSLDDAIRSACHDVGIAVPRHVSPGKWAQSAVDGKARSNKSGRVLIFDDEQGGIAWNWTTGQQQAFSLRGDPSAAVVIRPRQRDPDRDRRERDRREAVARICHDIVHSCRDDVHPYLASKGFPDERAKVHDDPRCLLPRNELGDLLAGAMPTSDQPMLIVPGWIGDRVSTVQFITASGEKKNILSGAMSGASYRIATSPRNAQNSKEIVCEGFATALSVRAAIRILNIPATIRSAFSASNAAKVACAIPGAWIAADHDRPIEHLDGLGTGEFYARKSGCKWTMPASLGDFNDFHMECGLRSVALHFREVFIS